jgi:type I restriction enzyme, S subunit
MQVTTPKKGYKLVKTSFGKYEEIPEEWEYDEIKTIGEIVTGSTPSTSIKEYYGNEFSWAGPPDLDKSKFVTDTKTKLSKKGFDQARKIPAKTIMVSCIGDIGKIAIAAKEMSTNQQINSIICKSNDIEFIYYQLLYSMEKIKNSANQAVISIINKSDFGLKRILIPPLPEQTQIVSILSNVDDTIQKTDQIIKQTQRLKKGMMQKLLTRGIGHSKFKKVPWLFGKEIEIPEEWEVKYANDLCSEIIVGIVIKPASLYSDKGVSCLRSFNIHEDKINEKNIVLISEKSNEDNIKSKFRHNDVLIVRTGYPGTSCVVPKKFVGGNCVDLIIARPHSSLDSFFLSRFINSTLAKIQIKIMQGGAAQQHFNVGEMKKIKILLPLLPEQQQIASILSNIDTQIQKEKLHKSNLERLKKGLMQKLLTGQIRVKV